MSSSDSYPPPVPVPNATQSFWLTEPHPLANHRSTDSLPTTCDILIIGAGYSGVATAYHLLSTVSSRDKGEKKGPSIVILEAREACSGATGRNGGQVKPDLYTNIPVLSKKYGAVEAAEFARFEARNVLAVKALVEKEEIDCDFQLTRSVDVYLDPRHAEAVEESYRELAKQGIAELGDVMFWKGRRAEELSGVKGAKACLSCTAGHVWPYKMVMHLLQVVVNKGANLQTTTPVTSISSFPDSNGCWTVATPRGSIKATKVVFATNAYTSSLLPQFVDKIVPVRGICSYIKPPTTNPAPFLPYTYSIRHGPGLYDYLIPRHDGSIVVGGAKSRFWGDRKWWYGVSNDSEMIEPARDYFDGLMQRTFRGWEENDAVTGRVWTGIMGWSSDFMPYVGDVPTKPGQVIIAGFTGHGMPQILLAAKGIAEMLSNDRKFEETEIPKLFKPSIERLVSKKNEILDGLTISLIAQPKL